MTTWDELNEQVLAGKLPDDQQALQLADVNDVQRLMALAAVLRDRGHGNLITYSPKVFVPLTHLCRDVCHYCTFARTPKTVENPYLSLKDVLELCRQGAHSGCKEALFTLGEKPELRYRAAREALNDMGFNSTLEYVKYVAAAVLTETGLLPHINAGCMCADDIAELRQVSASMGLMLESASPRLCEKGMPHYGSPDKVPKVRLTTIELAGQAMVPFTTGILIGIGESRRERIQSLLALRTLHQRYGHLQEVIIQNFRAKKDTKMSNAPEPDLHDLLWTIAIARIIFGEAMNIQAPPNLSPGVLPQLIGAGINDWGGVSPITPDFVNPEAPWPHLEQLAHGSALAGKHLEQRLTIYPRFVSDTNKWLDPALTQPVLELSDASGFARPDSWAPGEDYSIPHADLRTVAKQSTHRSNEVEEIVNLCIAKKRLSELQIEHLFASRGDDFNYIVCKADELRQRTVGSAVTYVVNRNINYTNICILKCQFCAFSKGKTSEKLRGRAYDISGEEIARRCREAWHRGATEVCMQGGIHPDYTGQTYLDILNTVREATPGIHIHAFSPLEVWQGAETLGISLSEYLALLKNSGLDTLPGTAAEILDDKVREILCPDKISSAQWLDVMETAHRLGLRSTATIMFGHIDSPRNWAKHLLSIRDLQQHTGGFTEFVPLPFVPMEAPLYLKGRSRRGPTFRETVLMHAISRLVFHGLIDNIQTSWVKMGESGVAACLAAGANDLGGTLMNESITRAAGATHGQEWNPEMMETLITSLGRIPQERTTLYGRVDRTNIPMDILSTKLEPALNESAQKYARNKRIQSRALDV